MQVFDTNVGAFVEVFTSNSRGLFMQVKSEDESSLVNYYIDRHWTINSKFSLDTQISGGIL